MECNLNSSTRVKRLLVAAVLLMVSPAGGFGAETPAAEAVLTEARATAAVGHKAIFIHFSASWCKWCRRLESFLHDPVVEPVLQRHFVLVRLVVRERDPNKHLDHAGGMEVLAKLGGAERGIPFMAVLGADGTMLANSLMKSTDPEAKDGVDNLGYPGDAESIAHFLGMLRAGAPTMTADELKVLEDWLVANTPK